MSNLIDYPNGGTIHAEPTPARLVEIEDFGPNPGNLRMQVFAPPARTSRPIIVILHGCQQDADGYSKASGWMQLAVQEGFILLFPGQRRSNNRDGCFQWFDENHIQRGQGEVASIRQMIADAICRFDADPARVFITGLSAGGAMAGAMLATYPEVFAAGAIIAGLPHGTARTLADARASMAGRTRDAKTWGDLVRAASPHRGRWPAVAVWHGMADPVVNPINAGELIRQWTNVHGVGASIPMEDQVGTATRRVWRDQNGRACVTEYSVPGLGHGAPVDDRDPPAPFFLPAGLSSTRRIAQDWGLTAPPRMTAPPPAQDELPKNRRTFL